LQNKDEPKNAVSLFYSCRKGVFLPQKQQLFILHTSTAAGVREVWMANGQIILAMHGYI
jgi:hypothetical protein